MPPRKIPPHNSQPKLKTEKQQEPDSDVVKFSLNLKTDLPLINNQKAEEKTDGSYKAAQKGKNYLEKFWFIVLVNIFVTLVSALILWLMSNFINNLLNKIENLEKNYTSEKDARISTDNDLDKRLSIIEHDHDRQDKKPTK